MQRALMWLNLYGRQAVQCRLKRGVKTQKMHFYTFFDLTTKYVESHQCLLHQFILLTQGPIPEIFAIKYLELAELENDVLFLVF